jgi:hypothetical protein
VGGGRSRRRGRRDGEFRDSGGMRVARRGCRQRWLPAGEAEEENKALARDQSQINVALKNSSYLVRESITSQLFSWKGHMKGRRSWSMRSWSYNGGNYL